MKTYERIELETGTIVPADNESECVTANKARLKQIAPYYKEELEENDEFIRD